MIYNLVCKSEEILGFHGWIFLSSTWTADPEDQREGILPMVVAEQYAQLLVEVDGNLVWR